MKKTAVIIGTLLILVGGSWVALKQGDVVNPTVDLTTFDPVAFSTENVEFSTSTDESGNVIKTGIRVPIRYDFPVATTTFDGTIVYTVEEIEGAMEMNFGGYNQCRQKGGTQVICFAEFNSDIEYNVRVFQENVQRELDELKDFQDEIEL